MKLYLDTSVYGGYYDVEFQDPTKRLFALINKHRLKVFHSAIVESEISAAPEFVKNRLMQAMDSLVHREGLKLPHEATDLAHYYILGGALSKKSLSDALHIALATYHKMDYIISWNFKHMVHKKNALNVINLQMNEKYISICSPIDFVKLYSNEK